MRKKMALIISFILVAGCLFTGCSHAQELGVPDDTKKYCDLIEITPSVYADQNTGVLYYRTSYGITIILNDDGTPKNIKDFQNLEVNYGSN